MSQAKPCDLCQQAVNLRYRIQSEQDGDWVLICPQCWQQVSQDNPYYRYGGTWKARSARKR